MRDLNCYLCPDHTPCTPRGSAARSCSVQPAAKSRWTVANECNLTIGCMSIFLSNNKRNLQDVVLSSFFVVTGESDVLFLCLPVAVFFSCFLMLDFVAERHACNYWCTAVRTEPIPVSPYSDLARCRLVKLLMQAHVRSPPGFWRWLLQGCPASAFIFNITLDPFLRMFEKTCFEKPRNSPSLC